MEAAEMSCWDLANNEKTFSSKIERNVAKLLSNQSLLSVLLFILSRKNDLHSQMYQIHDT